MIILLLLIVLICTVIGALVDAALIGLGVGVVLSGFLLWAASGPRY